MYKRQNHNRSCLSCVRSGHCELQELAHNLGVEDEGYYDGAVTPSCIDDSAAHMIRDNSKCVLCRRCSAVCEHVQGIGVIGPNMRGFNTHIGSAFEMGLGETSCVSVSYTHLDVYKRQHLYGQSRLINMLQIMSVRIADNPAIL